MKYINIQGKIVQLFNKINKHDKEPHDYGTKYMLYPSEIHMIEAIYTHDGCNASDLANIMGITNGAVNQVVNKLIKKELVEQYRLRNNKKDIYYRLTGEGTIANTVHSQYHKEQYDEMTTYLNKLDDAQIHLINDFLEHLLHSWPRH